MPLAFSSPPLWNFRKHTFPRLSEGGGVGGVRCSHHLGCSEIKERKICLGRLLLYFSFWKLHFVLFLLPHSHLRTWEENTACSWSSSCAQEGIIQPHLVLYSVWLWVDLIAEPHKVFCYQSVTSYSPFPLESFKKNCKMTTWVRHNCCRNSRVVGESR